MKCTQKIRNVHGQRKRFASSNARDTNMLVFLALANAKVLSFALCDVKVPNASSFASQWNIGFSSSSRSKQTRGSSIPNSCSRRRHQNSLPLTTNLPQNVTEPSKGISYPVTKLTGPCACTLHSNPIPPTDGKNGLL